jgi:epsilon-lactone hydrolase
LRLTPSHDERRCPGAWIAALTRCGPRHLTADIRAAGGNCELQVWPDQVHVFQALPRLSPEAAKAMAQVARFIDTSRRANGFDAIAGKAG